MKPNVSANLASRARATAKAAADAARAVASRASKNQGMGGLSSSNGWTSGGALAPNSHQTSSNNNNTGGASAGTAHTHNMNNHTHSIGTWDTANSGSLATALNNLHNDLQTIISKLNAMS